jgi:hypothetical protein
VTHPIDHRPIAALIQTLPKDRVWTSRKRDLWLRAMEAVIDMQFEVESAEAPSMPLLPPDDPSLIGTEYRLPDPLIPPRP